MKKTAKTLLFALLICLFVAGVQLFRDKQILRNDLIRLHVVANSDSREDQAIKLVVKDAVVSYLQAQMKDVVTVQQAKDYIADNIPQLTTLVNRILVENDFNCFAKISLCEESFGKRDYDTFSLPSGVYESLRVEIGNAEGKNWWCVVFPSLCIPASTDGFQDAAASSGFDQNLTDTLSGEGAYEIRFAILDWLGKIENFFFFK